VPGSWRGTDFLALLAEIPAAPARTVALARWATAGCDTLEDLEAAGARAPGELAGRAYAASESSQLGTTSGSTGVPKLVAVTIGARLATGRVQAARYGIREDDVVLALTPLITGTADALGYHGVPQVGCRLALTEHFDADAACRAIVEHGASVVIGVPTMAMRLLASPAIAGVPPGAVRLFLSHGASLPRSAGEAIEARLGCRVMQAFGTFDYGGVCATSAGDPADVRLTTVGRPLDGNELVVLDEAGRPVAPGAPGRLHVRGVHANAGYFGNPEATRAAWATGYHDLAEIGRQDAAGNVTLLGRARDLIIRGGQNIVPAEVEDLLARHAAVSEVAVVGLPHPTLGEIACACVVTRAGVRVSAADLLAFLRALGVAAFKLPERIEFLDSLPVLATGHKVDRRRLRESVLKGATMERRAFLRTVGGASATLAATAPRRAAGQPPSLSLATTTGAVGLVTQVVKRAGLDARHGLRLDIKVLDPAGAEKAVLLRQVDAGLFPVVSAADVNTRGQSIVLFGPLLFMHTYVVVWKDSPYRTLGDLRGKKVALLDKVSGAYRGMEILVAREGGAFEKDFQVVTAPPPAVITFLQRKQVEGILIHEPLVSKLLAEGTFRTIMALNDEWKRTARQDWLFLCLAAHQEWLERNAAAAGRLAAMMLEASQMVNRTPDLVEAEAGFLGLKAKAEIDLARERLPRFFPTEWNEAAVANVMETVREAVRLKQIPQAPAGEFVRILRG
jgi:non-ribosomal peptide synthetase component E (peptide arylation enzyme)/ABC-type nitrate/sulfonate/bicarbonate transport system substrate-binding protein